MAVSRIGGRTRLTGDRARPTTARRFAWAGWSKRMAGAAIVAASAGTVASMVAAVVLGPLGDQVLARDGWSNRDIYTAPEAAPGVFHAIFSPATSEPHAARRTTRTASRRFDSGRLRMASDRVGPTSQPRVRHSMCVRLCDGFYFPIGDARDDSDLAVQSDVCASACPGAPTRLFVLPSGQSDMSKAESWMNGAPYTALPVAYAHTTGIGPTCACHAEGEGTPDVATPMKDITMRDGDSVMTDVGWRVYRGGGHWPRSGDDFTPITQARNLSKKTKATLVALENATLHRPPVRATRVSSTALDVHVAAGIGIRDSDGRMVRLVGADPSFLR